MQGCVVLDERVGHLNGRGQSLIKQICIVFVCLGVLSLGI